jgi:hypothetical protein
MDVRFALVEPVLETFVIDHPRRLSRESQRQRSQETVMQNERWPLWAACAPDSPSYPWEWMQQSVPRCQTTQPQGRIAAMLTRTRAGLRFVHSGSAASCKYRAAVPV